MLSTESSRVVNVHVSSQSSNSLHIRWQPPTLSNGPLNLYLLRYRLTALGDCPPVSPSPPWSRLVGVDADQLQAVVTDLRPYAHYQLKIWARTAAGRGQVAVAWATTAATGIQCDRFIIIIIFIFKYPR